jgi:hypothetical protein
MNFDWQSLREIKQNLLTEPEKYTAWFQLLLTEHYIEIQQVLTHES